MWQWRPDMAPTVSAHLSRPCFGILVLCGYIYIHIIATLDSTICVILLICLSFCHHPSRPRAPPTHLLIYTDPILMNSMNNNHQKLVKTSHYLLAWLVVQKLIDN